ncbi:uridine kinase [Ruminococcaceae bacterium FB2012]|nr:uridine kinase [Ruminococcaceae bacterium FB2012]
MKKFNCLAINKRIQKNMASFVRRCEEDYQLQIETVADSIAESRGAKPIILLAGPSGSGKTTSALRLEEYLDKAGMETHTISMDNYFLPLDDATAERTEDGSIDFESPSRLDLELLDKHIKMLSHCEEIEVPTFDFARQTRGTEFRKLKRKENELIIFEGIHALNPAVMGEHTDVANGVYVSVRTRLESKTGELLHPSHLRLMRRLIRDKLFRGRDAIATMEMFASVERGEDKYIMPHKHNAQYSINTFMAYEPSAYKRYLLDDLRRVHETGYEFDQLGLMIEMLEYLEPIDIGLVPGTSLVREFVGGSELAY